MNQIDLHDKHAIVTGGAQGIGLATTQRLLASGARVTLWDQDEAVLENTRSELASEHGKRIAAQSVDVADQASVEAAASATRSASGPVHLLVNSAGIAGPNAPTWQYPVADWQRIMNINLTGTFLVCRSILDGMVEQGYGRIVNIASVAGKEGNPYASAYSASKAGVIALTKSIAKETAELDIAVNCITPAAARTRIFDQMAQEHIDYMLSKIPRGRFVQVEEIAAMVAWLLSAENSYTTGSAFDLSGGRATY